MDNPKHILLVRTDSIGDVVLTLPLAGFLKEQFPKVKISFLAQSYTAPVIKCCDAVDHIYEWNKWQVLDEKQRIEQLKSLRIDVVIHVFPVAELTRLCKRAKIKTRIATSHRLFTWFTCNRLVNFKRKNSDLHESQLNFQLLKPLGIDKTPSLSKMISYYKWNLKPNRINNFPKSKFKLILHPKSKGSARDWPIEKYKELIQILPESKFSIFISGTEQEAKLMTEFLDYCKSTKHVQSICGNYNLTEFIQFISEADGLLAASTGPLHIAAASGIHALGLYPAQRPMHPGRWQAIGTQAQFLVGNEYCSTCNSKIACSCKLSIEATEVAAEIMQWVM